MAEGNVKFTTNSIFGIVPCIVSENSYDFFNGTVTKLSIDFNIDNTFKYYSQFYNNLNSLNLTHSEFYYFRSCN